MSMRPRSLVANIISGVLTAAFVISLSYFIYDKQDLFSPSGASGRMEPDSVTSGKPIASERIDEKQVEDEMNRIAEEKRKAEEVKKAAAEAKRKAEEARKKAEAEKKRLAELEAKKKAEAAEKKRLDEIALKKKQEEEKKKKDEEARQQKLAEEKKEKQKQEEIQKQKEAKAIADKKAAADAEQKRKADEAKKAAAAAAAKAKADADAKAKAEAAENDRIANAYLSNASFVGALQQALYDNWVTGTEMIGYTATVVFYVDQQGNITRIDDGKSKYSGFQSFDDSVKAAVMRTKRIKMPDNKHAVNKLVKEGVAVTFDPKDYGF